MPEQDEQPAVERNSQSVPEQDEQSAAELDGYPEAGQDEQPTAGRDGRSETHQDEQPEAHQDRQPEAHQDRQPETHQDEQPATQQDIEPEAQQDEQPIDHRDEQPATNGTRKRLASEADKPKSKPRKPKASKKKQAEKKLQAEAAPRRPALPKPLITVGLLVLVGALILGAYGIMSVASGDTDSTNAPNSSGLNAQAIDPTDNTANDSDSAGPGGDEGAPPAAGPATPAEAVAQDFGVAAGQTVKHCANAEASDDLCFVPYLTNMDQGRFLLMVGAPFSEFTAWALVEKQSDRTFAVTQKADFEDEGEPPFAVDGPLAGIVFTSALDDEQPRDRLDDGSSPVPVNATELTVFVHYVGLSPTDSATLRVHENDSLVGDPNTIRIELEGTGWSGLVLSDTTGGPLPAGNYTAYVVLNGARIAEARVAVAGPS